MRLRGMDRDEVLYFLFCLFISWNYLINRDGVVLDSNSDVNNTILIIGMHD